MVGLYKDPLGENVFSKSDHDFPTGDILSAGVVAPGSIQLQRCVAFGTEDTLKRRIKELERIVSTYQVTYLHVPLLIKARQTEFSVYRHNISI